MSVCTVIAFGYVNVQASAAAAPGTASARVLTFDGSTVLSAVHPDIVTQFLLCIATWLPDAASPSLLFRMSRDGITPSDFHSRCDGKRPTVVLIRSDKGFVFGGYADKAWHNGERLAPAPIPCTDSFIFTVWNPHGIPPTRYAVSNPSSALYGDSWYGPIFGNYAIALGSGLGSHIRYGVTPFSGYVDTTGLGEETFTGKSVFTAAEVEVWQV